MKRKILVLLIFTLLIFSGCTPTSTENTMKEIVANTTTVKIKDIVDHRFEEELNITLTDEEVSLLLQAIPAMEKKEEHFGGYLMYAIDFLDKDGNLLTTLYVDNDITIEDAHGNSYLRTGSFDHAMEQIESTYNLRERLYSAKPGSGYFSLMPQADHGVIYEITENNFIDGFEKDLEQPEISSIFDSLSSFTISEEQVENIDVKYILELYSADGGLYYKLLLDETGNWFTNEHYKIQGDNFSSLITEYSGQTTENNVVDIVFTEKFLRIVQMDPNTWANDLIETSEEQYVSVHVNEDGVSVTLQITEDQRTYWIESRADLLGMLQRRFSSINSDYAIKVNEDYSHIDFYYNLDLPAYDAGYYVIYIESFCICQQLLSGVGADDWFVSVNIYNSDTGLLVTSGDSNTGLSYTTADWDASKQLTPSQLIEFAGLHEGQYSNELLERFIRYYDITVQNVQSLNIELLLSEFAKTKPIKDVSSIFSEDTTDITTRFAEDIIAIAFYENINTSTHCVYYDFTTNLWYKANDMNMFSDLLQIEPKVLASDETEALREAIISSGVLQWKNSTTMEPDISDPQSMCIAIRFSDGCVYRTEATGVLSECGFSQYETLRELLLGDDC